MTASQKLILLFIYSNFATNQYTLIRVLDRANYDKRGYFGEDIKHLKENELILVSRFDNYGNEFGYSITEIGKTYILENLNDQDIINYVSNMINPDHIKEITKAIIDRKNAN